MEELQKTYEELVKSSDKVLEEEDKSNPDLDADTSVDKEIKKLQSVMAEQVIEATIQAPRDNSDDWNTVVHIGVTGSSGAGKSAFINALRGMEAEDVDAAEVGLKETTSQLSAYKHPKHPNLIFWDMPGVGSPHFPKTTYLKNVCFRKYDFFMIVSSHRFTVDDLWLVEQTQEHKKRFYFIRANIDLEIFSNSRLNQKKHSPEKVLLTVRDDCYKNLIKAGIESPKVFLVDNHDTQSYDFKLLEKSLAEDFGSKMEAMSLTWSTFEKHPPKTREDFVMSSDEDPEKKEISNIVKDADAFIDEEMKKLQSIMEEQGIEGVKQALKANSEKWKNTVLHFAVTGSSGAGKSAFINALRGIEAEDEGGAEVGVKETTTDVIGYKHPKNPSFIVWDMPGVGTPEFPEEKYLERVEFHRYDFFIIVSNTRFTRDDLWLAKQTQEQKKRFYFIRSKIDLDIYNDSRSNRKRHSPEQVLYTVRDDCYKNLIKAGIKSPKVFLVDNHDTQSYDFGQLEAQLIADSDNMKVEAMALSLSTLTKEVLQKKKEILERRIDARAIAIACEIFLARQQKMFEEEISYYKDQFNLDDKTLQDNRVFLKLSEENLNKFQTFVKMAFCQISKELMNISSKEGLFKRLLRLVKVMFGLGLPESTPAVQFSCLSLHQNLDKMYKMALKTYDTEAQKGLVHSALTPGKNPTTK